MSFFKLQSSACIEVVLYENTRTFSHTMSNGPYIAHVMYIVCVHDAHDVCVDACDAGILMHNPRKKTRTRTICLPLNSRTHPVHTPYIPRAYPVHTPSTFCDSNVYIHEMRVARGR